MLTEHKGPCKHCGMMSLYAKLINGIWYCNWCRFVKGL
jgi:ribosomal protein L37AE/L43A